MASMSDRRTCHVALKDKPSVGENRGDIPHRREVVQGQVTSFASEDFLSFLGAVEGEDFQPTDRLRHSG
jgi:hypothetical protein